MPESKFKKFVRTNGPTLAIVGTGIALTTVAIWGQKSRDAAYTQWLGEMLESADRNAMNTTKAISDALNK